MGFPKGVTPFGRRRHANMKYTIQGARLEGCSVVLGENKHVIDDEPQYYGNDPSLLQRLKNIIGMNVRYTAGSDTTTADLCTLAARQLMDALPYSLQELGAVISVTQTPDYQMPGNAHVLHGNLGMGADVAALDIGMGCSGFVYGLWLASLIVSSGNRPVLLVTGDTLSKKAGHRDKTTAPLFGDAGSASLIAPSETAGAMHFVLHADGSRFKSMYVPAGGSREPVSPETGRDIPLEDGGFRSAENVYMDGFGIFRFTMTEQPRLLREVLEYSGKSLDGIDVFVLHQANRYIVETITKKAGISKEKAPADVFSRFGNQNAASIPGVLCGSLAERLRNHTLEAVLQGYGTGLSWGACQLRLENCLCLPPAPYVREKKNCP